jgi:outer membrane receptor protein involved in Fe transport
LLFALQAWGDVGSLQFQGRTVVEVITEYEAAGYQFIYSSDLVRSNMRFSADAPPGLPVPRLSAALREFGLTLSAGQGDVLRVVRKQVVERSLSGRITDTNSGDPLAGVKVEIEGAVVFTDQNGRFTVMVADVDTVTVSREGYVGKLLPAALTLLDELHIGLSPEPRIEEVVVISSRYAIKKDRLSQHSLDADELNALPELGDDALRAANRLPGMASIGLSAKPYVRGGLQDEMLVVFNNIELLEPFHLKDFQSVFSGLNPSLIKSIDVYTGGFPARYGDRMSGVMDIAPADDHRQFGGEVLLSLLTAGASGYGSMADDRGRWALSGRRGNLDWVTRVVNPSAGDPAYSDWFGQLAWELDPATELDLGVIVYNDDIKFTDFDEDGEVAHSKYRNTYGWVQLHRDWSPTLTSSTLLSFGSIRHSRNGFVIDEDPDGSDAFVDDDREFQVWSLAQHMFYDVSSDLVVEFGGRLNYQSGKYDYVANIERHELAEFIGLETSIVRNISERPDGMSGGAYVSARFRPQPWLSLETGLRWDFQDYLSGGSEHQISPRLSAKFDLSANTRLRLSVGRFFQPEGIHEMQVVDGLNEYQEVQHADHYIVGLQHDFGNSGLSLRAEAFHKTFQDPKRRFENLFNPLVLLPELASDRIEIRPEKARARGLELTVRYHPDDNLNVWLSYTKASAEDRIDGAWRPRTWDQSDTISSGLIWNAGHWSMSAALIWHTGWRTTRLPSFIGEDDLVDVKRNDDRLPDYLSLDARISRTWERPSQSFTFFAEVTNLTNRDNVGAVEYEFEENEDLGGFDVFAEQELVLPLVPSIGFEWKF